LSTVRSRIANLTMVLTITLMYTNYLCRKLLLLVYENMVAMLYKFSDRISSLYLGLMKTRNFKQYSKKVFVISMFVIP
jgi:hypothetical protein